MKRQGLGTPDLAELLECMWHFIGSPHCSFMNIIQINKKVTKSRSSLGWCSLGLYIYLFLDLKTVFFIGLFKLKELFYSVQSGSMPMPISAKQCLQGITTFMINKHNPRSMRTAH